MIADQLGAGWYDLRVETNPALPAIAIDPADVGPVTITHGRRRLGDPITPGTLTVTIRRSGWPLIDLPTIGDRITASIDDAAVTDQLGGTAADAAAIRRRFAGYLTDISLTARPADRDSLLTFTAVADVAQLGRVRIGAAPWPQQLDGPRAAAILAAVDPNLVRHEVGGIDPGTVDVLPLDVDSTDPLTLLDELAASTGGRIVPHRDGRLFWHDAEHRRNAVPVVELHAGNIVADGAVWSLDTAGVVTALDLVYGPGEGEARPVLTLVDDAAEAGPLGRLAARITTDLADGAGADLVARRTVGRRSVPRWRLDSLTVDVLRTVDLPQTLALLALSPSDLIAVTGLPAAGPATSARLFVEGYTETSTRHAWRLVLDVVDYALAGSAPRWADVPPAITWADVDYELTWLRAAGWAVADGVDRGRWLDVPSSTRWADVDPAHTWDTYPTPTPTP